MSTHEVARHWYENTLALRTGKITPDQFRERTQRLMDSTDEATYQAGKIRALTFDINRNG
jgi:hypothetical protein